MRHDYIYEQVTELWKVDQQLKAQVDEYNRDYPKRIEELDKKLSEIQDNPQLIRKYKEHFPNDRESFVPQVWQSPAPWVSYLYEYMTKKYTPFYFDETVVRDEDLINTGKEFFTNGILKPPFDDFFFHAPKFMKNGTPLDLFGRKEYNNYIIFYTTNYGKNESEELDCFDIVLRPDGSFYCRDLTKTERPEVLAESEMDLVIDAFYQCMVLLNHPAYEQESMEVSPKLNIAREKKGRNKLRDYILVKINKAVKLSLTNNDGTVCVPHWRRGHLRRLASGAITPVRACMVNWKGESIEPKIYKVAA